MWKEKCKLENLKYEDAVTLAVVIHALSSIWRHRKCTELVPYSGNSDTKLDMC
jgi:hypothetical protein